MWNWCAKLRLHFEWLFFCLFCYFCWVWWQSNKSTWTGHIHLQNVSMTSTIHHPVAIPSRGLIICEMEEESNEPKTILEIGGVSRPKPTYILPPPRAHTVPTTINTQPYMSHWKTQHDIVSPPYPAFTAFQEQRIVRLSNDNWNGPSADKMPIASPSFTSKGFFF